MIRAKLKERLAGCMDQKEWNIPDGRQGCAERSGRSFSAQTTTCHSCASETRNARTHHLRIVQMESSVQLRSRSERGSGLVMGHLARDAVWAVQAGAGRKQ